MHHLLFVIIFTIIHKGYGQLILPKWSAPKGLSSIRSVSPVFKIHSIPPMQSKKSKLTRPHASLDREFNGLERKDKKAEQRFLHVVQKLGASNSLIQLFFDACKEQDTQVLSYLLGNPNLHMDIINAFQYEDHSKMTDTLQDVMQSNPENVVHFLLSSGLYSRNDIIKTLVASIPPRMLASMVDVTMENQKLLYFMIVSSVPSKTIATILNNGRVQQVFSLEDFAEFFIQLIHQSSYSEIYLNEAAQRKLIRALLFKGKPFVQNLFISAMTHPYAISIIMKTELISRKFIMDLLLDQNQGGIVKTVMQKRNVLYNIHVENLLKDSDFAELFFKAINTKDLIMLELLNANVRIKSRVLEGIKSDKDKVGSMFKTAIKYRLSKAIDMFGDANIISSKDLMQQIQSQFGFGPFANRNDYVSLHSILYNPSFLSVLTSSDAESILNTAIQRKYLKLVFDLPPTFYEKISSKFLVEMKLKIQNMRIEIYELAEEKEWRNLQRLIIKALDDVLRARD